MKKKEIGNILINSFTNKKFPLFNLIELKKKKIDNKIKIFLGNKTIYPYNRYLKKHSLIIPNCIEKNKYIILNILNKKKINFVIPTSDRELLFWSKNKNFFKEKKINVFISSFDAVKICLDKLLFHNFCKKNNIPDINILKKKEYTKNNLKLVVKERFSFNDKKIIINKNYNYIKKHIIGFKNPIFQKYIIGKEISIDAYINDNFKVEAIFLRKREFVCNGESQVTTIFSDKNLEKKFITYLEFFKFSGFVMMQAKILGKKIYIIECNPRIGGASTLSIQNGIDVFKWQINTIVKKNYRIKFLPQKKRKLFRFPVDFYY